MSGGFPLLPGSSREFPWKCARVVHWDGVPAVGLMSDVTDSREGTTRSRGVDLDAWIRPLCALVVAGVAAYASYVHQREFALQGGAATVGLLKPSGTHTRSARGAVWSAFLLGIAVSLAANVAAGGRKGQAKSEQLHDDDDPLVVRARLLDARHRELHQRPASGGTLRKELRVGARRSRQLAALVRRSRTYGTATEAPRPDRTQGTHQEVLGRVMARGLTACAGQREPSLVATRVDQRHRRA